jgi:hypothetical protein
VNLIAAIAKAVFRAVVLVLFLALLSDVDDDETWRAALVWFWVGHFASLVVLGAEWDAAIQQRAKDTQPADAKESGQ